MADSVAQPRLMMMLLGLFASLAAALASVGIYGVMSYLVTERMREIGIRMALGAQPSEVLKLMVQHGMMLALVGLVIGVSVAFALARVFSSLLLASPPRIRQLLCLSRC